VLFLRAVVRRKDGFLGISRLLERFAVDDLRRAQDVHLVFSMVLPARLVDPDTAGHAEHPQRKVRRKQPELGTG